jgi:type IV secretion system protein VirB6
MIVSCPSGIAADTLARDVLASADCLIAAQVQQGYATLLAPGGTLATALTIALTIYVAIFGYRLMLGLTGLTLAEVVPHFVKIGVVFALVTSWPGYQTLVFDTLFHGPEQLADGIVQQAAAPGTTSGDVLAALQEVFNRLADAAGNAWGQTPPAPAHVAAATPVVPAAAAAATPAAATSSLPALGPPQFIAALLWFSALMLLGASVGVLLVVRIVLALLLLLGPVFIAFALFQTTRGLAEGWLRVTVKFSLVPLFALPLIAVAVAVLGPLVARLDDEPVTSVRDGPGLLVLLVVLVFAAVMSQAARLGSGIAGGIRLPRRPLPIVAAGAALRAAPAMAAGVPALNRADAIVQAIDAGGRRAVLATATTPTTVIAGVRAIASPAITPQSAGDTRGRLGQGYRRLAIGQAATATAFRLRN